MVSANPSTATDRYAPLKICIKCRTEKTLDDFPKQKRNKDGREGACRTCVASSRREKYAEDPEKYRKMSKDWADGHPEKIVAARKRYRKENPERVLELSRASNERNKDARLASGRAWYAKNSAKKIAYSKEWYEKNTERAAATAAASGKARYAANPEIFAERSREYRAKNPERISALKRSYKARKKGAEGVHTAQDVLKILEGQRGLCANCKKKLFKSGEKKFHVDHVVPLAKGGSNWPSNLQCLCPVCNMRKGSKDPLDWANENGRLL